MFTLSSILTENTNLVRIYFIDKTKNIENTSDVNIHMNVSQIQNAYKNWKTTKYIVYSRNELNYLYDLTDDNQMVFTLVQQQDDLKTLEGLYAISYKMCKLPTHVYPCLNDIDNVREYTISEYKITNRISIIIESDEYGTYAYIEYKHSQQVDIEKINSIVQSICDKHI